MRLLKAVALAVGVAMVAGCASTKRVDTVEPATQQFLDAVNSSDGPPIYTLAPADARQVLVGAQSGPIELLPARIEDRTLAVGPTGQTRIRIIRPEGATAVLPVVMYFHGGGWMLGDTQTHGRLVRDLAVGAGVAVVFVDYDRAPEARFPIALEQCYAVTKYVADHPGEFGVDGSRIAVAGDSAGGTLAAAVPMLAMQRGGPAIKYQLLFYPVTDARFDTGSYESFAEGFFLTRKAMIWFWDAYLPDAAARSNPLAAPLNATIDDLRGLPPALVITGEHDVLRDEGEAYAHRLTEAGVRVIGVRFLGTIHDFVMLNGVTNTPAARAAIELASAELRRVFAR